MTRASLLSGLSGLAAAALIAACGDTTTLPLTLLNLDRPVDVSFACYGGMRLTQGMPPDAGQKIIQTAMPTAACEALSPTLTPRANVDGTGAEAAAPPVAGQEMVAMTAPVPAWYAFILQSSSGTVAVATWAARPSEKMTGGVSDQGGDFNVLDADPLTPGKNAISIGEDPIAIITDKAGCFEVTANAGSCDLSELEINTALDDISGAAPKGSPVRIDRVSVKNRAGAALLARPSAMIAEPGRKDVGNYCPNLNFNDGTGTATPSGKVYIAYPTCHLVAGIDLAKGGEIFSAIRFDATGTASVLTGAALDNVSCPAECSDGKTPPGTITPGPRPVALDFKLDTRIDNVDDNMDMIPDHPNSKPAVTQRLAIGAEKLAKITVVNLDLATFEALPVVLQVPLEDRPAPAAPLDVTAVALSLQIGMGGDASAVGQQGLTDNTAADHQAQFVYAVASDGTVRVADVLNLKHECDTQVDGRFLRGTGVSVPKDVPSTMCIDNTARTMPREVGARGPGIVLPDNGIPTSVAIFHPRDKPPRQIDMMNNATTDFVAAAPSVMVGHFATITAASGTVFVVNIDDDYVADKVSVSAPVSSQPVLVMAHQLRDNFFNRDAAPLNADMTGQLCTAIDPTGGGHAGGPRLSAAPAQTSPTNTLSADYNPALPKFHDSLCISKTDAPDPGIPVSDLEFGATRTTRDASYPDLKSIASETWTMTYEGTLSLDNAVTSVDGPTIREATINVDGLGMHLVDQTAPFCDMGVEPFDVVDLRGCDPSHGNGDCPADYQCYVHPKSNVAVGACLLKSEAQRLTDTCFQYLISQRRYTVGGIRAGQVQLLERKHELAMTPVDGCTSTDQCNAIARVAAAINPSADPYRDPALGPPFTTWSCQADPLRKPVDSGMRCVQTCTSDAEHLKTDPRANCSNGSICRLNPGSATDGVCIEGVEPPQSCLNGPQRFDVRASEAFAIIGQRSGFIHPWIKNNGVDATKPPDACILDPKASPLQVGRIPLKAPPCTGSPAPNPCEDDTGTQGEIVPVYQMPPPADPKLPCVKVEDSVRETRVAPAIKVSNPAMSFTLVDPTYPGDGRCFLDRNGNLGRVPFAVTGYRIEFEQKAGYEPFQLQLFGLVTPVKVVHGPSESIWIIDDGDFISTSITQASTRGRVFRVESSDLVGNTLQ